MGFPMGFELILSCFVLILSYLWFDFVDFVFGLSNVEMGCGGRPVIVGWCLVLIIWVEMGCGGRPMIVGWCCVCVWVILS